MRRFLLVGIVLAAIFVGLVALGRMGLGPIVITEEGEQKIILMFGKPQTVTKPGLFARVPMLSEVDEYPSLELYLNVDPESIQTKDQERIVIDNYVVWRISDPIVFLGSFPQGIDMAKEQINRVVKAAVREVVGKTTLLDVLSTGREDIRNAITERTAASLADRGVEIKDVRITRTELPQATEQNVFARMVTDRERLARKSRAEGEEEARTIRAEADREARVTIANAQKAAEIAMGTGDAEAARVYAEAYSIDPAFYAFVRSMEVYRKSIGEGVTMVLSSDSEFFQYIGADTSKYPSPSPPPPPESP